MKKDFAVIGGLLLVIVGLIVFGGGITPLGFIKPQGATPSAQGATKSAILKSSVPVTIGALKVNAEVAATPKQQQKGLSGRDSMAISDGMLFVFDKPGTYTFWMKGMRFALDFIWMDQNKKIIDITKNVNPEVGRRDSDLTRYSPADPTASVKYVLEVNAGLSDFNNINVGDTADFQL